LLSGDNGNEVFSPFGQRDLVDADDVQLIEIVPIHGGVDTALNGSLDSIVAYVLFATDIFHRAIDQLQH